MSKRSCFAETRSDRRGWRVVPGCRVAGRVACAILLGAALALSAQSASATEAQTFYEPAHDGHRIDACLNWGADCYQPAADAFCRSKGFTQAVRFRIAKDIGATHPTMVMGEGKLCDMPHCDGFEFIKCD